MISNEQSVPFVVTTEPQEAAPSSDIIVEQVIGTLHLNLTQPECSGRLG
jgi:hypothetical protein